LWFLAIGGNSPESCRLSAESVVNDSDRDYTGRFAWLPQFRKFGADVFTGRSMRHVLSALVTNQPGVLAHISGMLASRAYNIDSLAVGETENPEFSRITFVVRGDARVLDQVRKQLEKVVTVVKVLDFSNQDFVERDLMLIKVATPDGRTRSEIKELVDIFRAKIVDVSSQHFMIEISGQENKVVAFIEAMRSFGILEMVRTGRIAMLRSGSISVEPDQDQDDSDQD
jgi:acetolactate synthase-1/3 small subunit